jgi:hypothetical protein
MSNRPADSPHTNPIASGSTWDAGCTLVLLVGIGLIGAGAVWNGVVDLGFVRPSGIDSRLMLIGTLATLVSLAGMCVLDRRRRRSS